MKHEVKPVTGVLHQSLNNDNAIPRYEDFYSGIDAMKEHGRVIFTFMNPIDEES